MARPTKSRHVTFLPGVTYFRPVGIPTKCVDEVVLSLEEAESARLKDLEGLGQEEGARRMRVSRPTFQRILSSAHRKTADAILHGKAVRIEGGHFEYPSGFRCAEGHEWANVPGASPVCPVCGLEGSRPSPDLDLCERRGRSQCCLRCPRGDSIGRRTEQGT